ncbi:hypothetical protein BU24DRAFT_187484 [Aaosphaeria arxii CBS 175.79]|uniref:Uncharacterized protein n=1 Tax=Aaosphaeria arxii CBS 175.79 TaxID=1450172 RepID=A0A6A5XRU4_9PLEO|nr:uncharacterized protein BU24DRAFT_187484 [Aaosphaeria arxii CBS 175.79]KAF2015902.1 hypothetical protein BU24DRAFT_187484 [Aaosphaeria arxii CBS 175.79]
MGPETLPPYRHVSSNPIGNEDAAEMLATFIKNSEIHPHLHPDALITPTGVQFGSHGGPSGGVVMHNLRRVAAGLRGEHLEPEPSPEPEERNGQDGRKNKRKVFDDDQEAATGDGGEEWQDKSEYEREEGRVEIEEIGDRDNFVASGVDVPEVEGGEEEGDEGQVGEKRKANVDKEARKLAKKARHKEFKKSKGKKNKTED